MKATYEPPEAEELPPQLTEEHPYREAMTLRPIDSYEAEEYFYEEGFSHVEHPLEDLLMDEDRKAVQKDDALRNEHLNESVEVMYSEHQGISALERYMQIIAEANNDDAEDFKRCLKIGLWDALDGAEKFASLGE